MDRQTQQITLPISGMIAEIITKWKFGEYQKVENLTTSKVKVQVTESGEQTFALDQTKGENAEFATMKLAILKLTDAAGVEIAVTEELLYDLDFRDGQAIRVAINAITAKEKKA